MSQNDGRRSIRYKTGRNCVPLKAWMRSEVTPNVNDFPSHNVLLLDGGVSTFLEKKVEKFHHNELWSSSLLLERNGQKAIQECHETFYKVGLCDIISTVTYQCHYLNCPHHSSYVTNRPKSEIFKESEIDELLRKGVHLANEARRMINQDNAIPKMTRYIVASIGCYGGALADGSEYRGNYGITVQDLIRFHERRFGIFLSNPNIDGIVFETIPCVVECEAIISLLSQERKKAVWISMACRDGEHLNDGSSLTLALDRIDQLDPHAHLVDGVGVNCCSLKYVPSLTTILAQHQLKKGGIRRAIVFYPNSGESWDGEKWVEGTGCTCPDEFADTILSCISHIHTLCRQHNHTEMIPIIVGGCCRTTPETIRAIRTRIIKEVTL